MKTTILLVRHGQSVANVQGVFCGQSNFPLSPLGEKQVKLTGEYLESTPIDVIYSSDLKRAYDTARAIADFKNIPVIKDPLLREINCGYWEGKNFDECEKMYPQVFHTWKTNTGNTVIPGGESVKQVSRRITKRLTSLAEIHKGQTVCIGSHAMAIRSFCGPFMGISLENLHTLKWAPNASVTTVVYENGNFTVMEYGYDAFLKEFSTTLPQTV